MDVFIDDKPYSQNVDPKVTLAALVNEARESLTDADRIIVAIRCNGDDITGEKFDTHMATPVGGFARVDLHTGEARDLVEDAMTHAISLLDEADADRMAVVEKLGTGKTSEGIEHLGQCMHRWHQVHQGIVNALAILNVDLTTIKAGEQGFEEALGGARERLTQVKDALETRDYVLLSDTLQYEFTEVGETWRAIIGAIQERLPDWQGERAD